MAWDAEAGLDALVALLQSIPGMQSVRVGAPETLPTTVTCYVTLGGVRPFDKALQLLQRDTNYLITWGYRVAGAEANAERKLCEFVDQACEKLYTARKDDASPLKGVTVNATLADEPQYQAIAGQEVRRYPIIVTIHPQRTPP